MEFKGTKGKWEIIFRESSPNNSNCVNHSINVEGVGLIDVWASDHHPCKTREEATANVKLIASAPKLLEMLNLFIKEFEYENATEYQCELFFKAKQLIKKATE